MFEPKRLLRSRIYCILITMVLLTGANTAFAADIPVELYGKLNLSFDHVDPGSEDWISNASRLGIKGQYNFTDSLSLVYQIEQQVDAAHGGKRINTLLSTRNSFIGLKGSFGHLVFGTHDTPMKESLQKVDQFNDQIGDIKILLPGEVRARDSWLYHSPKSAGGFQFKAMYVPSDNNFSSSQSISLGYESGRFYLGVAADSDMRKNDRTVSKTRVYDSIRGVLQYSVAAWTFGAVLQNSRQTNSSSADHESGYSLSVAYKVRGFTLLSQYGQSDILKQDASNLLLGVDRKFAKNARAYLYYQDFDDGSDSRTISLGFEFKFRSSLRLRQRTINRT